MQTERLTVTGMTCGGCVTNVTNALNTVPGVSDAKVSLGTGEAIVQYDEKTSSAGQLKSAVEAAGYGVNVPNAAQINQSSGGCCGGKG